MFSEKKNEITTPVLILTGPTAIGKTELSIQMAERYGCEIISADSMQVYKHMDIGTAKPAIDERKGIPHYLLDIVNPDEQYSSAFFVRDAIAVIKKISASGRIPLITGGTGLYIKALTGGLFEIEEPKGEQVRDNLHKRLQTEGREVLYRELKDIDSASADRIHVNDTQRLIRALEIYHKTGKSWSEHIQTQPESTVKFINLLQICLTCDRKILHNRIEQRTVSMFKNGLVEEAKKLQEMGYSVNLPSMQAIGYRHANNLIAGHWDEPEATRLLMRDTRRYAKRQMTWFSKDQSIHWFERTDHKGVIRDVDDWLGALVNS